MQKIIWMKCAGEKKSICQFQFWLLDAFCVEEVVCCFVFVLIWILIVSICHLLIKSCLILMHWSVIRNIFCKFISVALMKSMKIEVGEPSKVPAYFIKLSFLHKNQLRNFGRKIQFCSGHNYDSCRIERRIMVSCSKIRF